MSNTCKNCRHYGSDGDGKGSCYLFISKDSDTEEDWENLNFFFKVKDDGFCGKFARAYDKKAVALMADELTYWNGKDNEMETIEEDIVSALDGNIESLQNVIAYATRLAELMAAEEQAGADI